MGDAPRKPVLADPPRQAEARYNEVKTPALQADCGPARRDQDPHRPRDRIKLSSDPRKCGV